MESAIHLLEYLDQYGAPYVLYHDGVNPPVLELAQALNTTTHELVKARDYAIAQHWIVQSGLQLSVTQVGRDFLSQAKADKNYQPISKKGCAPIMALSILVMTYVVYLCS